MQYLKQFVRDSRDASQTVFFGHYPTSTIGSAVYDVRKLFGSVHVIAAYDMCSVFRSVHMAIFL